MKEALNKYLFKNKAELRTLYEEIKESFKVISYKSKKDSYDDYNANKGIRASSLKSLEISDWKFMNPTQLTTKALGIGKTIHEFIEDHYFDNEFITSNFIQKKSDAHLEEIRKEKPKSRIGFNQIEMFMLEGIINSLKANKEFGDVIALASGQNKIENSHYLRLSSPSNVNQFVDLKTRIDAVTNTHLCDKHKKEQGFDSITTIYNYKTQRLLPPYIPNFARNVLTYGYNHQVAMSLLPFILNSDLSKDFPVFCFYIFLKEKPYETLMLMPSAPFIDFCFNGTEHREGLFSLLGRAININKQKPKKRFEDNNLMELELPAYL